MGNFKSKFLIIVLVKCMLFAFISCGNSNSPVPLINEGRVLADLNNGIYLEEEISKLQQYLNQSVSKQIISVKDIKIDYEKLKNQLKLLSDVPAFYQLVSGEVSRSVNCPLFLFNAFFETGYTPDIYSETDGFIEDMNSFGRPMPGVLLKNPPRQGLVLIIDASGSKEKEIINLQPTEFYEWYNSGSDIFSGYLYEIKYLKRSPYSAWYTLQLWDQEKLISELRLPSLDYLFTDLDDYSLISKQPTQHKAITTTLNKTVHFAVSKKEPVAVYYSLSKDISEFLFGYMNILLTVINPEPYGEGYKISLNFTRSGAYTFIQNSEEGNSVFRVDFDFRNSIAHIE